MTNVAQLLLAAGVSLVAIAAPAAAQTYNWSFIDDYYGQPDITVAGTISNLIEGVNFGPGLTITITSSPYAETLGAYTYDYTDGQFIVSGGEVTYANALFGNSANGYALYFGTSPGDATWYPEFWTGDQHSDLASVTPTQFSAAGQGAVPEVGSWGMMIAGFGMIGAAMRRRRSVAVSFG